METIEIVVVVYGSFALLTTTFAFFVMCFNSRCRGSALLAFVTGMAVLAPIPMMMFWGGDPWDKVFFAVCFVLFPGPILAQFQILGAIVMFENLFRYPLADQEQNGSDR